MLLYRTAQGLARGRGDQLELLDVPHADLAALLAEGRAFIEQAPAKTVVALADARILAPVVPRGRIILNGANYIGHVEEAGMPVPSVPLFLDVEGGGFCAPETPIRLPAEAPSMVDYEGELVLIIAKPGQDIARDQAWAHVGGFTIGNDVSARCVQLAAMTDGRLVDLPQVRRSKSFPTFKPMGPAVLVAGPEEESIDLLLETRLNGEVVQRAGTGEMLFDIPAIVEHVSRRFALETGDIIFTGTPAGVALATGRYLAPGDTVEVSIEAIGTLRNRIVA